MQYPAGFPPHWQATSDRALIEAERELHRTLSTLPPPFNRDTWDVRRTRSGNAALALVLHVIPSFTSGACEAIRQGHWSIQRGREAIDEWVKNHLIPRAHTLAHLSTYVRESERESEFEQFRDALLARVHESDVWGACLDALLAVADESIEPATDAKRQDVADEIVRAPVSGVTPHSETPEEKAARRQAVLQPLLDKAGLNRNSWADKADRDANSVYRYWRGERGLNAETKGKLAKVLGIAPTDLPD